MKPSNFLINVLVKERVWGMEGEVHTFNTPLQVIKNTREHEPSPLPSGSQVRPGHLEDTVRRPCPKRSFFSLIINQLAISFQISFRGKLVDGESMYFLHLIFSDSSSSAGFLKES